MSVESAVADLLLDAAGVTTLVGSRVYQLKLPQAPTFPCVRVQLITEREHYHLQGSSDLFRALVQVDAFAQESSGGDPYASATAVADAINAALSGQLNPSGSDSPATLQISGMLRNDRQVRYDPDELRVVTVTQEYIVWWKPL